VGANGAGKSSLLKVLAGIEGLDSGSIGTQKGVSIGYLPQEGLSLSGRSVFAECMTVFADLRALEDEQEQLARRMAELDPEGAEYAQVAERFHRAEGEFRARDGYAIDAQVGSVLSGLGFPQRDWKRRTEEFSGGWQMRIALAKLLLERPTCCCSTSPPTISTWKPATGWKSTSPPIRMLSCWCRTTGIFWMSPCARSASCGTKICISTLAVLALRNPEDRAARAAPGGL